MLLQLIDVPRWFLINMFLRAGFSRCLQPLVHWCSFHGARSESEWFIGLLLRVIQECVYQKQQRTSNIVDELMTFH